MSVVASARSTRVTTAESSSAGVEASACSRPTATAGESATSSARPSRRRSSDGSPGPSSSAHRFCKARASTTSCRARAARVESNSSVCAHCSPMRGARRRWWTTSCAGAPRECRARAAAACSRTCSLGGSAASRDVRTSGWAKTPPSLFPCRTPQRARMCSTSAASAQGMPTSAATRFGVAVRPVTAMASRARPMPGERSSKRATTVSATSTEPSAAICSTVGSRSVPARRSSRSRAWTRSGLPPVTRWQAWTTDSVTGRPKAEVSR
ncbi:hypothetical protein CQR58_048585 [Streptomyces acidiscabies]|uniref:hypothetical protein n=1 Tax=Streptomyces acidiscabies TaxID=42234 RepID=UPI0034C6B6EF